MILSPNLALRPPNCHIFVVTLVFTTICTRRALITNSKVNRSRGLSISLSLSRDAPQQSQSSERRLSYRIPKIKSIDSLLEIVTKTWIKTNQVPRATSYMWQCLFRRKETMALYNGWNIREPRVGNFVELQNKNEETKPYGDMSNNPATSLWKYRHLLVHTARPSQRYATQRITCRHSSSALRIADSGGYNQREINMEPVRCRNPRMLLRQTLGGMCCHH